MQKKAEILTYLAQEDKLDASCSEISAPGIRVKVGDNYLYIDICSFSRAERVIPLLFTISATPYAHSYYELSTDQKLLVTAASKPLADIIGNLTTLEHLDLEAGELLGKFQTRWHARDVAVTASTTLAVQGEVAIAKINFTSHFRDSEQNCKKLLEMISLKEVLRHFSTEACQATEIPDEEPIIMEGSVPLKGNSWRGIFEKFHCEVEYLRSSDRFVFHFDPNNHLELCKRNDGVIFSICFKDPLLVTPEVVARIREISELEEVTIKKTVRRLTVNPGDLLHRYGFKKDDDYHTFSKKGLFDSRYDVKTRVLHMETVLPLKDEGFFVKLNEICRNMDHLCTLILKDFPGEIYD